MVIPFLCVPYIFMRFVLYFDIMYLSRVLQLIAIVVLITYYHFRVICMLNTFEIILNQSIIHSKISWNVSHYRVIRNTELFVKIVFR